MFTGIITEIGIVHSVRHESSHLRLIVEAPKTASETALGESIDINGACQTVVSIDGNTFAVDTVRETLKKTTLGRLTSGSRVNLEQAIRPTDRLGGHIVSGHVDCIGTVRNVRKDSADKTIEVTFPDEFVDLVVPQGSITIDGVSLTVASLEKNMMRVAVIPTTWKMTTLSGLISGSSVNLEFDLIGKYVMKYMNRNEPHSQIDEDRLRELGF